MSRHLDGTGSGHPITGFLDLLEGGLDEVADTQVWSMNAEETTRFIVAHVITKAAEVAGAFCHVHHTTPWSEGGETNARDAVLLCPFHHHQAHVQDVDYPIRT